MQVSTLQDGDQFSPCLHSTVSGEPPTTPVVSKKSGLIYEQRLILKYIQENGKDPVTGEELSEDDLVELKPSEYFLETSLMDGKWTNDEHQK